MKPVPVAALAVCVVAIGLGVYVNRSRPTESQVTTARIQVGSVLQNPVKIKDVAPTYPQAARAARAHGTVMIEATINSDGAVQNAHVIRSIPLLDEAALDAVKGWRFEPLLFDGAATPVTVTLAVPFSLQ